MNEKAKGRPTIGLLISQVDERYQAAVWPGVVDLARERDVNLLIFVGESLRSPYGFDAQGNVLYDLAGAENVDSLAILSGSVGNFVGIDELQSFCQRYAPLPMVSVALPLEGIPSVLVDNEGGAREAVVHLVQVHGARRIAYIRGPEGHEEAEERYRAYVEVLGEQGLALDPSVVAAGDFSAASAAAAIRQLVEERRVTFDAVVAAGDAMALGALEALQARGIRVPSDVAVVGFDDIEEARFVTPPLTTVRQPLYEQGRQAVEMLLSQLEGEAVPPRMILPTRLVVRQSCGCLAEAVQLAAAGQVPAVEQPFEQVFAAQREKIVAEVLQLTGNAATSRGAEPAVWVDRLLDAFSAEMRGELAGIFLPVLDRVLQTVISEDGDVAVWQQVLSVIRRFALPCLGDGEIYSRAEDLWHEARVQIGDAEQRVQARQRLEAARQALQLHAIGHELSTAAELAQLVRVMAEEVPQLGIESCYLSLYDGPAAPAQWSRLILAYSQEGRVPLEAGGQRFPSRQLVPGGLLSQGRRYTMVVLPFFFRNEALGFGLLEMGPRDGAVYRVLRGQISSALKGALLFEERGRLLADLEDRAVHLQTAAEVSRTASSILDLDNLVQQVVDLVGKRFGLYHVGLLLVEQGGQQSSEGGEWLVLRAATGEPGRQLVAEGFRLQVGSKSIIGWCAANKEARMVEAVHLDDVYLGHPLLPETRSEMCLPLAVGERLIGVLDVQSRVEGAFDQDDLLVLQTLAGQLAVAIENARVVAEMRRLNQNLQETLEMQAHLLETIRELSTPVMPMLKGGILLPLVGHIDSDRAQQIMENLLAAVKKYRARVAVVDITGVSVVDTAVANSLLRAAHGANLIGAEVVLVGMRPEVARTIITLGLDLSGLITAGDLRSGIEYALRQLGPEAFGR